MFLCVWVHAAYLDGDAHSDSRGVDKTGVGEGAGGSGEDGPEHKERR